ncbi:7371_t:CDS:2 [Entrophospora sp. SA101]|nr:7371_t:CDS:2 [Entrophospora sp. SA101]
MNKNNKNSQEKQSNSGKLSQKQEYQKYLEELEDPNYQGGSWALPENPTPLEKAKYDICKQVVSYKLDTKISTEEIAQKLQLSKAETEDILYYPKNASNNFAGTLLLPPPNITGNLHLGHAFETVIQDFLVRFSYLNQEPIYWIAGIDHAGISTQSKIEKLSLPELDSDEKKRNYTLQTCVVSDIEVEHKPRKIEFNETPAFAACREIKEETNLIVENPEKVAEEIEEKEKILAVKFVDCNSSEVKEGSGLYRSFFSNFDEYLKPLNSAKNDYLLVATSRPETIFADVALFVNPHDKRFKKYLGESVRHPFTGKIIPILADENIKIDFGSGVLKCTPGHDFTDYQLGKKYQLPIISCCDEKGILNELAGPWQGRKIGSIREEFVTRLTEEGICVKVEEYETNLVYSSKSGEVIEPLLSQQWFLDLPTLIKQVEKKQPNFLTKINFTTSQFRKTLEE